MKNVKVAWGVIVLLAVQSGLAADPPKRVERDFSEELEWTKVESHEEFKVRQCCECLCVPDYDDPRCYLGECLSVAASSPCPAPYTEPHECPTDSDFGPDEDLVPDYLDPGDLLFLEAKPWVHWSTDVGIEGWDHIAMYVGDGIFIEAANYPGARLVTYTPMSFYYLWADEIAYGRVATATEQQRLSALDFVEDQLYLPYQDAHEWWWANPDPDDPDDPYSDAWYCSELVWAGYMQVGINIDATPGPMQIEAGGDGIHTYVSPQDIAEDDDVELYDQENQPPAIPERPDGPTDVCRLQTRLYSTSTTDPEGDMVQYYWGWDETQMWLWSLPHFSGATMIKGHTWNSLGYHQVRVKARDIWGNQSDWSEPLIVLVHSRFDIGWCGSSGGEETEQDGFQTISAVEIDLSAAEPLGAEGAPSSPPPTE